MTTQTNPADQKDDSVLTKWQLRVDALRQGSSNYKARTRKAAVAMLRDAKRKINHPGDWRQGVSAEDWEEEQVPVTSQRAVGWCASGALWSLGRRGKAAQLAEDALDAAAQAQGYSFAAELNDASGTEHSDVLALFDAAETYAQGGQE